MRSAVHQDMRVRLEAEALRASRIRQGIQISATPREEDRPIGQIQLIFQQDLSANMML